MQQKQTKHANHREIEAKVNDAKDYTLETLHYFWLHEAQIDEHTIPKLHFDP